MSSSRGIALARVLAVAGAYFAAARLGLAVAFHTRQVWPPTGVALAAVVLWGYRVLPGVALGAFVANLCAGEPALTALGVALGNAAEALIGAWMLARSPGFRRQLDRMRDVAFLMVVVAAVSTLASATIGVISQIAGGVITAHGAGVAWRAWWLGDVARDMLGAPLLLVWASYLQHDRGVRRGLEAVGIGLALGALTVLVFSSNVGPAYALLPLVFAVALRNRQLGAASASFCVASVAVWMTAHGHGPFIGDSPDDARLRAVTFVGVVALTAMLAAAVRTERERAEDLLGAVSDSEERMAEAQRIAHLGSWDWDIAADHVTWSDELYRIAGQSRAEWPATYEGYLQCIHEDDRERARATVGEAYATGRPYAMEHRIVRPNGEVRILACQGEVELGADGTPVRMRGIARDVTDSRRERSALRLAQEQFQTAFAEAPSGMAVVSPDGRWLQVNDSLCEIVGYSTDELLRLGFQAITHPDDLGAGPELMRPLLAGERSRTQVEKRYIHRDGSIVWVRVSTSLVRDAEGEPLHYISHIADITEAKATQRALEDERRLLAQSQAVARTGSWEWDLESGERQWSAEMFRLYGLDPAGEVPSLEAYFRLVHDEDRARLLAEVAAESEQERPYTHEFRVNHPHLGVRTLLVHGDFLAADPAHGERRRRAGTVRDVTAEREAEGARRALEERNRVLISSLPDAMVVLYDPELRCVQLQGPLVERLGLDVADYLGTPISAFLLPRQAAKLAPMLERALNGEQSSLDYLDDQGDRAYHIEVAPYRRNDGSVNGAFAVWRDVTDRKRMEAELERLATHDSLTGLLNRRVFHDRLADEVARAGRHGTSLSLALLDLDHFKAINDEHGHPVGDRVLREFARRLEALTREGEAVARIGGEEFAWILPNASERGAHAAAERARLAICDTPFAGVGDLTLSAGVCELSDAGSAEELYACADDALYRAKQLGRNQTFSYRGDVVAVARVAARRR
jgi:diguanylate cyclase (GGDEF)-like protein/PAS domain S-box-containing protein